jgi:hypothetical protein
MGFFLTQGGFEFVKKMPGFNPFWLPTHQPGDKTCFSDQLICKYEAVELTEDDRLDCGNTYFIYNVRECFETTFPYVLKLSSVSRGLGILIFEQDLMNLMLDLQWMSESSSVAAEDDFLSHLTFYDLREGSDNHYNFCYKNGRLAYRITKKALHNILIWSKHIENVKIKNKSENWFRLFMFVVASYRNYHLRTHEIKAPTDVTRFSWILSDRYLTDDEYHLALNFVSADHLAKLVFTMMRHSIPQIFY